MIKINQLIKQAEALEKEMQKMEYNGSAGGKLVNVILDGEVKLKSIIIDSSLTKDKEKLEKLVVIAAQNAKKQLEVEVSKVMSQSLDIISNINNKFQFMKQADAIQKKTLEKDYHGSSEDGLVSIVLDGHSNPRSITIDSSLTKDKEMLEDLIIAAFYNAKDKIDIENPKLTSKTLINLGKFKF